MLSFCLALSLFSVQAIRYCQCVNSTSKWVFFAYTPIHYSTSINKFCEKHKTPGDDWTKELFLMQYLHIYLNASYLNVKYVYHYRRVHSSIVVERRRHLKMLLHSISGYGQQCAIAIRINSSLQLRWKASVCSEHFVSLHQFLFHGIVHCSHFNLPLYYFDTCAVDSTWSKWAIARYSLFVDFNTDEMHGFQIQWNINDDYYMIRGDSRFCRKKTSSHGDCLRAITFLPIHSCNILHFAGFAFHADSATFYNMISEDFAEREICELSEIQLFPEQHMMAIVQKGSPLRKMITYG